MELDSLDELAKLLGMFPGKPPVAPKFGKTMSTGRHNSKINKDPQDIIYEAIGVFRKERGLQSTGQNPLGMYWSEPFNPQDIKFIRNFINQRYGPIIEPTSETLQNIFQDLESKLCNATETIPEISQSNESPLELLQSETSREEDSQPEMLLMHAIQPKKSIVERFFDEMFQPKKTLPELLSEKCHDNVLKKNQKFDPLYRRCFSEGEYFSSSTSSDYTLLNEELAPIQLIEKSSLYNKLVRKSQNYSTSNMSLDEFHYRHNIFKKCGLDPCDYYVLFLNNTKKAFELVAKAYPFENAKNTYITALDESIDEIRDSAKIANCTVIAPPISKLNLGKDGSLFSSTLRKGRPKSNPKGLFSYPFTVNGEVQSLHWISEAHRELWHVLIDATDKPLDRENINFRGYKPDFLVCISPRLPRYLIQVACLLVKRSSIILPNFNENELL